VGDAQDLGVGDLYSRLCGLLHSPDRQFGVPLALIRALAWLTGTSAQVSRLFDPLQVDWTQTQARLGWQPPHSIDDELHRMVTCYLNPA
jgi:UDP-glucose 4-epimerase